MDDLEHVVASVAEKGGWAIDVAAASAHVRERVQARSPNAAQVRDLCIAYACCEGDPGAEDDLLAELRDAVGRVAWPGTDSGDRCARVWSHILDKDSNGRTRLATYDGRGPLSAWLRVVTTRLAHRERPRAGTESATEDTLAAVWATAAAGAEHDLIKDMYVDSVRDAFRTAIASLDETTRALLRLHYAKGVSLESLTRVYGVHRVTLSRRLAAARQQILDGAVAELTRGTAMAEGDCRSLIRTLRSRIELSLSQL